MAEKPRVVIVGGGSGGAIVANSLPADEYDITVIDKEEEHCFKPGALWVTFRGENPRRFRRPMRSIFGKNINFVKDLVTKIDLNNRVVETASGKKFNYDYLVVAAGVHLDYDYVEGNRELFETFGDFYHSVYDALRLRKALLNLKKGKFVVAVVDPIYKCPPAPHKAVFMAAELFERLGRKDKVEITLAVPFPHVYSSKVISDVLEPVMMEKGINFKTVFTVDRIDTKEKKIYSLEGEELSYDVAVVVPFHTGPQIEITPNVKDENDYIKINKYTSQIEGFDDAFAIGDCTNAPVSKSGVTAHLQAEVVADRIQGFGSIYTGRTNCPIVMGDKTIFVISDYDHPTVSARPSYFKNFMEEMFIAMYWSSIKKPRFWRRIFEVYFEVTEPEVLGPKGW